MLNFGDRAVEPADPSSVFWRTEASAPSSSFGAGKGAYPPIPDAGTDWETFFIHCQPLVRSIARSISRRLPPHVDFEDLIAAGNLGLVEAATRFDGTRQVRFTSYAEVRIRGAILDHLRAGDWASRSLRRSGRALRGAEDEVTSRTGQNPSAPELAANMGISLDCYYQLQADLDGVNVVSIYQETHDGAAELHAIAAPLDEDPLFRYLKGETRERIAEALFTLPERERLVLTLYYYEELNMKEIASVLNVVESRISQLHLSALKRLRTTLLEKPQFGCLTSAAKEEPACHRLNGTERRRNLMSGRGRSEDRSAGVFLGDQNGGHARNRNTAIPCTGRIW